MNDKEQFYRQIVLQKCVSPDFKELTHFLFFLEKGDHYGNWKSVFGDRSY